MDSKKSKEKQKVQDAMKHNVSKGSHEENKKQNSGSGGSDWNNSN